MSLIVAAMLSEVILTYATSEDLYLRHTVVL